MAFFYLVNCFLLAIAPHVVVYKCSGLTEFGVFWKCIQVGLGYMVTQLVKMVFLATFFPSVHFESSIETGQTELKGSSLDFLRTSVDLMDLLGLYLIMTYLIRHRGQMTFLYVGMSWASADLVATKFVTIWLGARKTEFDWSTLILCLHANLDLVYFLTSALLMWLFMKNDSANLKFSGQKPFIVAGLLFSVYRNFILQHFCKSGPLIALSSSISNTDYLSFMIRLFTAIGYGLLGLKIFIVWKVTSNQTTLK